MTPNIYLDLDKTLFNSQLFWQDTIISINKINNTQLKADELEIKYSSYYKDGSHYLDFSRLIKDSNINLNYLKQEIKALNNGYLLKDADFLLNWLDTNGYKTEIITIGDQNHQNLKIYFCGRLQKYKVSIINCEKNKYIKHFIGKKGILIDDKPNQQLPVGWLEFYIDRNAVGEGFPKKISNNVWVFNNLQQIPRILQTTYSV